MARRIVVTVTKPEDVDQAGRTANAAVHPFPTTLGQLPTPGAGT